MSNEKRVFISHSSRDFEFAMALCQAFEKEGIYCWIAPRDIPYGNVWAEEITQGIQNAKLVLFILSRYSAGSNQVVREISLALQHGLKVIPIRLDNSKLSGALAYYLSNIQAIKIESDSQAHIMGLIGHVKAYLEGGARLITPIPPETPTGESEGEEEIQLDTTINMDAELDAKFDQLFGPGRATEREEVSPFRRKLLRRIGDRVIAAMTSGEEEPREEGPGEDSQEEPCGKYFSLMDRDSFTQIFLIRRNYCLPDYKVEFTTEQLEVASEQLEDGTVKRTYFVDDPDEEGNPLSILTILPKQNMVVVNMGFLYSGCIKISKKPEIMPFSEATEKRGRVLKWPANEDGRKVLIDPKSGLVIPRKRYYDKKKKQWVTYIEIAPGKRYFAFEVRSEVKDGEGAGVDLKASSYDIAYGYYRGRHGLPKNLLKAAEFFEEAGTPEAHYYLGRIFLEDELLGDPEDARYYLQLALEGGEERARELLST